MKIFTLSIVVFVISILFTNAIAQNISNNNNNTGEFSEITRHLQNNQLYGSFIISLDGSCYLIYNNALYLKNSNSGDSWGKIADNIRYLSIDPKNSNIFYAIRSKNTILKSLNYGKDWITIQNGLPGAFIAYRLFINPHNNSEIFLCSDAGVYKTFDAGFTWQSAGFLGGQFIIDPSDKNKYYSVSDQVISLSLDAGLTWKPISNTLPKILVKGTGRTATRQTVKCYQIIFSNYNDSTVLLADTEKGLFITRNDGVSWMTFSLGLPKTIMPNTFFLSAAEIYLGGVEFDSLSNHYIPTIYKSDINFKHWVHLDIKFPVSEFINITGIFKDRSYSGVFITAVDKIAYIDSNMNIIGLNYGVTQHSIVYAFTIGNYGDKSIQYAIVQNNNYVDIDNYGLWRSLNQGISWEKSYITTPDIVYWHNPKIFISPFNPLEIWVFNNVNQNSYTIRSIDGGKSRLDIRKYWNIGDIDNPTTGLYGPRFVYDPINMQIRYFFARNGLLRYDLGTNSSTNLGNHGSSLIISNIDNNLMITNNEITKDGGWTWQPLLINMEEIKKKAHIDNYYTMSFS